MKRQMLPWLTFALLFLFLGSVGAASSTVVLAVEGMT